MELVYLWVKDYKNIQKQGFNFSPKFECEFKPEYEKDANGKEKLKDNCELVIKPKEYLENFFGKNINVTAIVGENGSGKSRILECLEKIILADNEQDVDELKYILVYHKEVPSYISNITISTFLEQKTVFSDICSLVYKYYVSDEEIHQAKYYSSANLHYFTLEKEGIVNILSAKQDSMNSFHISSFMYEPVKVEISLKSYDKLIQEHISFLDFKKRDEIEEILKAITDLYHQYLSICYIEQKDLDVDSKILSDKELLIQNTTTSLSQNDFNTFFTTVIMMKEYEISKMSQEQKDIYFHKDYWHYFEFDFIDEKERRYNHLSHGEKVIFSQLLSIFFYINANEELLFLFDEPEIALHPNWQKQYLNEVINLLQKMPKKYHFIFTTHSPFLLSDLAKENIIFLEKDKETGNCKNVSKYVNINSFGANIHTLLSHGFFMKDGLMGEFAKCKIDKAIKYLNQKSLSKEEIDYCENIISIIGEPIIKNQLQRMLDSKKLSEIDVIKKQIQELQGELAKKENKKDD
ncbi:MAG: ATP-binding protein [Campylobacterales bacterium]|nr:ATP-binding protein [Campylobacterales bacterium]